ncbi:hypothetical protein ACJ41O_000759 [Fusarium nematophilum]
MTINHSSKGVENALHTSGSTKPRLLVCASPAAGHTNPMITVAQELVLRGYQVDVIAGEQFREPFEKAGCQLIDTVPDYPAEKFIERLDVPSGLERLQYDMREFFIGPIKGRHEILYKALDKIRAKDAGRDIVVVSESFYMGTLPLSLGAPLPKGFTTRPKVVNIHAAPYMTTSIDTAPFGLAMPPDATEEGRAMHKTMHEQGVNGPWKELIANQGEVLASLGAVDYKPEMLFDTWTTSYDITLHMCPPSLEYPVSDLHPKIKFTGAIVPTAASTDAALPSFWSEVTRGDKKIVTVTQGTVNPNYEHLLLPTMQALADRDDILVVAILGKKGGVLPPDAQVPANARVIDYLKYSAILAHSSVFVLNAGYGGFIQGAINAVPMVLAGESEDKPEVANRAEYAGIGVNLKTETPTSEQIAEAVGKILSDGSYKARITEIRQENEQMRAMDRVEKAILETST